MFEFFSNARNLEAITPPWLDFEILSAPARMQRGAELRYRLGWHGFPMHWKTVILEWQPPHAFVDLQQKGPYALWEHTHSFVAEAGGTRVIDHVRYRLPFGFLGALAHRLRVRSDVAAIFDYRARAIAAYFGAAVSPAGVQNLTR